MGIFGFIKYPEFIVEGVWPLFDDLIELYYPNFDCFLLGCYRAFDFTFENFREDGCLVITLERESTWPALAPIEVRGYSLSIGQQLCSSLVVYPPGLCPSGDNAITEA